MMKAIDTKSNKYVHIVRYEGDQALVMSARPDNKAYFAPLSQLKILDDQSAFEAGGIVSLLPATYETSMRQVR